MTAGGGGEVRVAVPESSPVPDAPPPAPTTPTEVAVRLTDAAVRRGGRLLWDQGDFEIPAGSVVAVIGPNGSGKTTLLKVLLGLLPADGEVTVLGRRPQRGDRRIGYVPQSYTAATGTSVRARDLVQLGVSGARWGLGRSARRDAARVDGALAAVGARSIADRRVSELSGGQQQRVAIAQALVDDPALLLLDEPLANLDVRNQREIVDVLRDINRDRGVTILVVVHDLNPLLSVLTGAVYLLDGHAHFAAVDDVVDETLLSHLYGTAVRVVRTPQGDLFTRTA